MFIIASHLILIFVFFPLLFILLLFGNELNFFISFLETLPFIFVYLGLMFFFFTRKLDKHAMEDLARNNKIRVKFKNKIFVNKWEPLQFVNDSEDLYKLIKNYKLQFLGDRSQVCELDYCIFLKDAIEGCKLHYIGDKSDLKQLIDRVNNNISSLQDNLKEINQRISSYEHINKEIPQNLSKTLLALEQKIDLFLKQKETLQIQYVKIKKYFDHFSEYIEHLRNTELDIKLLNKINKNIERSNNDIELINQDFSSKFFNVSHNLTDLTRQLNVAFDGFAINQAIKHSDPEMMDKIIQDSIDMTSNVKIEF